MLTFLKPTKCDIFFVLLDSSMPALRDIKSYRDSRSQEVETLEVKAYIHASGRIPELRLPTSSLSALQHCNIGVVNATGQSLGCTPRKTKQNAGRHLKPAHSTFTAPRYIGKYTNRHPSHLLFTLLHPIITHKVQRQSKMSTDTRMPSSWNVTSLPCPCGSQKRLMACCGTRPCPAPPSR